MSHEASVRLDGRPVGSLTCLRVGIVLVFKLKVSGLYNAGVSCEHEKKKVILVCCCCQVWGEDFCSMRRKHWNTGSFPFQPGSTVHHVVVHAWRLSEGIAPWLTNNGGCNEKAWRSRSIFFCALLDAD